MKINELGPILIPQPVTPTTPTLGAPNPNQPLDKRTQGVMVAKQQQDKIKNRKAINDQIAALTKQIADLRRQLSQS